ncbi:MAG: family 43 glycosylhydrolase [Lachnospiraceae bacterium]|nr:family 43 glycosylhydrolase [Lachnospiraceae bacterium]
MRKKFYKAIAVMTLTAMLAQTTGYAGVGHTVLAKEQEVEEQKEFSNPTIEGSYADPEIHKYGQTYWVYPTYDSGYQNQRNFDCFASDDLKSWEKHENILDMSTFEGIWQAVWAPTQIEKNGKYYILFGANDIQEGGQVGGFYMGVADRPEGPYKNVKADGSSILNTFENGAQPIDAHMFLDNDKVYVYYGGWRHCNVGILNDTMDGFVPVENAGPLDTTKENSSTFVKSTVFKELALDDYVEGPYMLKRNGTYYLMYSTGGWTNSSYGVCYATSDNPMGPFVSKGKILGTDYTMARGAGHHSVVYDEAHDQWLICYHRRALMREGDANTRFVCIDKMDFDEEGNILPIRMTNEWDWVEANEYNVENLARRAGATYFAKSVESDGHTADKAFDGIIASDSRWAQKGGTGEGQYLSIDFGAPVRFSDISLKFQRLGFWEYLDGKMKFQTSEDGTTWNDITTDREWTDEEKVKKGSDYDNIELYEIDEKLEMPITSQYLRVYFSEYTDINSIYEFEVYDKTGKDKEAALEAYKTVAKVYTEKELNSGKYANAEVASFKLALAEAREALRNYNVNNDVVEQKINKLNVEASRLDAKKDINPSVKRILEAEDGELSGMCTVANHENASGGQKVGKFDDADSSDTFTVNVAEKGKYRLQLVAGSRKAEFVNASHKVWVNNNKENAQIVDYKNATDWDEWNSYDIFVELEKGTNTITVANSGKEKSFAELDYIALYPLLTVQKLEAEDAVLNGGATIRDREDASNGRKVGMMDTEYAETTFEVDAPKDGEYTIEIAAGSNKNDFPNASHRVWVNGNKENAQLVNYDKATQWDVWNLYPVTVALKAGKNTITVAGANQELSAAEVDYIIFHAANKNLKVKVGGNEVSDFNEKINGYDVKIDSMSRIPEVTVTMDDDYNNYYSVEVTQATKNRPEAYITVKSLTGVEADKTYTVRLHDDKVMENPLVNYGSDPYVMQKDGYYYYVRVQKDKSIWVSKTADLSRLSKVEPRKVYEPKAGEPSAEIWSPELHYLNGKWYIYYSAGAGNAHRMYVLESKTQNAQGEYRFKGQIKPTTDKWALDLTVLEDKEELYAIWSGWEGNVNVEQKLYIAKMSNPWTIAGDRVEISKPEYDWEKNGDPMINGGPEIVKAPNGTINLVYSASANWAEDSCLGCLKLRTDGDPMRASDWTKINHPIFEKNNVSTYTIGHACFVKSPDKKEDYVIYHATKNAGDCWNGRGVRVQRVYWNEDNTPFLGTAVNYDSKVELPSGTKQINYKHYEAEDASLSGSGLSVKETYNSSAGKKVASVSANNRIKFTVNVEEAGEYMLYTSAATGADNAALQIKVNDAVAGTKTIHNFNVEKKDEICEDNWFGYEQKVTLKAGNNEIAIQGVSGKDKADVDSIDICKWDDIKDGYTPLTDKTNYVPSLENEDEFTFYDGTIPARDKAISNGKIVIDGGDGTKAVSKASVFDDFTYETIVHLKAGEDYRETNQAGVLFRVTDEKDGVDGCKGYYFGLDVENQKVLLGKMSTEEGSPAWVELGTAPATLAYGKDYRVVVAAKGSDITCAVYDMEGTLVTGVERSDSSWTEGAIGVRTRFADADFSDIAVSEYQKIDISKVIASPVPEKEPENDNKPQPTTTPAPTPAVSVTPATPAVKEASVEKSVKAITSFRKETDIKGSVYHKLKFRVTKSTTKANTLKWSKVKGAKGYIIFGNRCGKPLKKIKTVTSAKQTKWVHKKLKKGTYYKYTILAYKVVDGKKVTISIAKTIHVPTLGGKYTDIKAVSVNKAKVSLKLNKTFKIKAKEVKKLRKKAISVHKKICYESDNTAVATVNKNGKIKAVGRGKCKVYAYAQNGVYKQINVTVK